MSVLSNEILLLLFTQKDALEMNGFLWAAMPYLMLAMQDLLQIRL